MERDNQGQSPCRESFMDSGMYAALSGNLVAMRRLDVVANNLANIGTAGFKKDRIMFESLLENAATPNQTRDRMDTDYSLGPSRHTGNSLDLAVEGDGFFVVNTPQGTAYTRQGRFHLGANGRLLTSEGYEVQGGGAITITGSNLVIDTKGRISVAGKEIATLDIVDFPKPYSLKKVGSTLFVPGDDQTATQTPRNLLVRQGYLEESNVNSIQEMAQLIETNRFFEACQKVMKSYDEIKDKAANEIGKL